MNTYDGEDILQKLADKGYTTYRMRKDNILPQGTLTKIRHGDNITLKTLNVICCLLECQISDIVTIEITNDDKIY